MTLPILLGPHAHPYGAPEQYPSPFEPTRLILVAPTHIDNSILVLHIDHVLRCISFGDQTISITEIVDEYPEAFTGGRMAAISPGPFSQACVYLQSRRLVIYDVVSQKARTSWLTDMANLEELASSAQWVSMEPQLLVVQIDDTTRYDDKFIDHRLRSFDLSKGKPQSLGTLELGAAPPRDFNWHAAQGIVVAVRAGIPEVFGPNLQPIQAHPMERICREIHQRGAPLLGVRLHPTQPRAIVATAIPDIVGSRIFQIFVADWSNPTALQWTHVATTPPSNRLFLNDFSPDGTKFVFTLEVNRESSFYLLSIDTDFHLPLFMGTITSAREPLWAREPTSLVVMDELHSIFHWRFVA